MTTRKNDEDGTRAWINRTLIGLLCLVSTGAAGWAGWVTNHMFVTSSKIEAESKIRDVQIAEMAEARKAFAQVVEKNTDAITALKDEITGLKVELAKISRK